MELVSGGELFDRIVNKGFYTEADARSIVKCLVEVLAFLHEQAIVHRDLKPENLLMSGPQEDADIKLADFGLATVAKEDYMLKTSCGTLTYVAPEILRNQPYGKAVDMWSLGVITYILLSVGRGEASDRKCYPELTSGLLPTGLPTILGRRRRRNPRTNAKRPIQVFVR